MGSMRGQGDFGGLGFGFLKLDVQLIWTETIQICFQVIDCFEFFLLNRLMAYQSLKCS